MKRKSAIFAAATAMMVSAIAGGMSVNAEGGSVYYLNYKPEVDTQW